jgi:hypothetical protein
MGRMTVNVPQNFRQFSQKLNAHKHLILLVMLMP